MNKIILITGSSGLIGSEVAEFFHEAGFSIAGVDNNQREVFCGEEGTTRWTQERLTQTLLNFEHHKRMAIP